MIHWNSMDTAQSPWPYLEVDQLAQLLTSSVHISPTPKFKATIKTSVRSTKLDQVQLINPTYTSSSNSSGLHSSDEDISSSKILDLKKRVPLGRKFKRTSKFKFKQQWKEWDNKELRNSNRSRKFMIIDCRYPYEFDGGHIRGALNLAEWPKLRRFLFSSLENQKSPKFSNHHPTLSSIRASTNSFSRPSRTVFVLHCEFSSHRAPQLFNLIRNHDRLLHFDNYPLLRYPKIYVLRGGYAAFYSNYPELCEPSSYLRMHSRPDLLGLWRRHCERVNRRCNSDEDDDDAVSETLIF